MSDKPKGTLDLRGNFSWGTMAHAFAAVKATPCLDLRKDAVSEEDKKNRILPPIEFTVPGAHCVICGTVIVDTGLVALCSTECRSEWMAMAPNDRPLVYSMITISGTVEV